MPSPTDPRRAPTTPAPKLPPHRTLAEVQADLIDRITQAMDPAKIAEAAERAALERARGAT
jgi:hypothetical protein